VKFLNLPENFIGTIKGASAGKIFSEEVPENNLT